MEQKDLEEKLTQLVQLDIDAVFAYQQAIERIDCDAIQERLREFQADHERHIEDLSRYLAEVGLRAPERSRDFKGFLISGFTAIRSVTGTEGALKAMQSNEQTTNEEYSTALTWNLPPGARAIVERNFNDERRHLEYVVQTLKARRWEQAA